MCERGDRRYTFQEWAPKYLERSKDRKKRSAMSSSPAELSLAAVREEVADMRESIRVHEDLLQQHRDAVITGAPSPLSPDDVDANEAIIAGLRANLPAAEAILVELEGSGDG